MVNRSIRETSLKKYRQLLEKWSLYLFSLFRKRGSDLVDWSRSAFPSRGSIPTPKCGIWIAVLLLLLTMMYLILLALEGTSPSIWHSACRRSWFWLAHKRSTRWSPACSKSRRLSLSSSQKANGDCCRRSKRNNLAKKREGTISLAPFLVIYLSNMSNIYATIQHILELVERHYQW